MIPRTLRGRLVLWFAGLLTAVLLAFSISAWFSAGADESLGLSAEAARADTEHDKKTILYALAFGLPPALAVAVAGGSWITRRALRPLDQMVAVVKTLDAAHLDRRVRVANAAGEELENLESAFNEMLARLESSVAAMRRFTADASHELRTPLAILTGELEVDLRRPRNAEQLRATMGRALDELRHLTAMVEGLLMLARSDAGQPVRTHPVAVDAVLRRVAERAASAVQARKLSLESDVQPATASADEMLLERLVSNLLDNAIKFTPEGGRVRIAGAGADGRVTITVDDSGPGIPPAERDLVFERFYRSERTRAAADGAGLGLALARDLAKTFGGEIAVEDSPLGGARLKLSLRTPYNDAGNR